MASLRVGLSQSNLKLNKICFENRYDDCCARGRIIKFARGGARLRRGLSVVAGGAVGEVAVNSDWNVAVRKKMVEKEGGVSGKVDDWIRDSVKEIVSKIEEAPFLVHIYPEDGDLGSARSAKTKIVREKAESNNWPNVKDRWERGSSIPNGIALVEELKVNDDDVLLDPEEKLGGIYDDGESTKVFGIVIQERGFTCPACYILKTCRVKSITGICTHFCIFRAECFGETADVQIRNQWLL